MTRVRGLDSLRGLATIAVGYCFTTLRLISRFLSQEGESASMANVIHFSPSPTYDAQCQNLSLDRTATTAPGPN